MRHKGGQGDDVCSCCAPGGKGANVCEGSAEAPYGRRRGAGAAKRRRRGDVDTERRWGRATSGTRR